MTYREYIMKLRNLTLVAGLLGAFFAHSAFSLGMGEIKLNSSLNEPLDAEIQLLNIGDLSELEMLVGLASREDFQAAGVERLFLLTDLRFKVDMSDSSNPLLRVTSRKPIREPYLDFLLELQWPSGRLLREYTLLLDLPVYATERSTAKKIKAASTSPQPQKPAPAKKSAPSVSSVPAPVTSTPVAQSQSATSSPSSEGGEYRVAPGDTAWGIAKKIKPDDASIMQSLAAVKQSNPHAFINGNINLLKQGAVLRLPSSSEISQLSSRDANAQVDFSQGDEAEGTETKTETAPQLDATGNDVKTAPASIAEGGGRLQLATPNDDSGDKQSTSDGVVSGDGVSSAVLGNAPRNTEALENNFAIFQEELDKTQRENDELKARLSIMEEQIATMSRLVEINDGSLRAAQVASQQASLAEDQQANETDKSESSGDDVAAKSSVAEDSAAADGAATTTETDTKTADTSKSDSTSSDAASASAAQKGDAKGSDGLKGWLDILLYPLIALLVILLAIVLFFRNRKQDDDEEQSEELSLQTLVADQNKDDELDTDVVLDEEDKQVLEEVASELEGQELESLEELELSEGEDVDPLGEADIYLSLGNYKQAEKVLLDAVEQSPEDASLRLKLMEVYVSSNELDKFDVQYQALAELENAEAGAKADSLRSELDSEPSDAVSSDEPLENIELDFDGLESAPADSSDQGESLSEGDASDSFEQLDKEPEKEDQGSSDFDLDLDLENLDVESLSSDIDEDMKNIELDIGADAGSDEVSLSEDEPLAEISESSQTEDVVVETSTEDDFDNFDDDLDVLEGEDECSTKLELAQAYMEMGDQESAKEILDEVVSLGDDSQQEQARKLLEDVT